MARRSQPVSADSSRRVVEAESRPRRGVPRGYSQGGSRPRRAASAAASFASRQHDADRVAPHPDAHPEPVASRSTPPRANRGPGRSRGGAPRGYSEGRRAGVRCAIREERASRVDATRFAQLSDAPLLLRGAAAAWPARHQWTRARLSARTTPTQFGPGSDVVSAGARGRNRVAFEMRSRSKLWRRTRLSRAQAGGGGVGFGTLHTLLERMTNATASEDSAAADDVFAFDVRTARAEMVPTGPGLARCFKRTAPAFRRYKNQPKRFASRRARPSGSRRSSVPGFFARVSEEAANAARRRADPGFVSLRAAASRSRFFSTRRETKPSSRPGL